jgi:hypothetical protein
MRLTFTLRNDDVAGLEVHVEPWCFPYFVPSGSVLKFHYEAEIATETLVETEVRGSGFIAVWCRSDDPPLAELDGKSVEPMWG